MTRREGYLTASVPALTALCAQALDEGKVLADWCYTQIFSTQRFVLELHRRYSLPNRNEAFFGELDIAGGRRSVMGCRQHVQIGSAKNRSFDQIRQYVMHDFLEHAHWIYPDGAPGGFTITKSLHERSDGSIAIFGSKDREGPVDWRELDEVYRWVMLTIELNDFVIEFGAMKKHIQQAVCVVQHRAFCKEEFQPEPTIRYRITVGYPFVPFAPLKNIFGFGPGKFGAAIKMYAFEVSSDDMLSVKMLFAAAPRCEKVLSLGKYARDPIYGGVRLVERLSLGRLSGRSFRDWLDSKILMQHCRVHQALIEGVASNWRREQTWERRTRSAWEAKPCAKF